MVWCADLIAVRASQFCNPVYLGSGWKKEMPLDGQVRSCETRLWSFLSNLNWQCQITSQTCRSRQPGIPKNSLLDIYRHLRKLGPGGWSKQRKWWCTKRPLWWSAGVPGWMRLTLVCQVISCSSRTSSVKLFRWRKPIIAFFSRSCSFFDSFILLPLFLKIKNPLSLSSFPSSPFSPHYCLHINFWHHFSFSHVVDVSALVSDKTSVSSKANLLVVVGGGELQFSGPDSP